MGKGADEWDMEKVDGWTNGGESVKEYVLGYPLPRIDKGEV